MKGESVRFSRKTKRTEFLFRWGRKRLKRLTNSKNKKRRLKYLQKKRLTLMGYTFPEKLVDLFPDLLVLIRKVKKTDDEYKKLKALNSIYNRLRLLRYSDEHTFCDDDPALLPGWSWLYEPFEKVEKMQRDLNFILYGDLIE